MKLLFSIRDAYPPTRPDVACLFGQYLPRLGVESALLAQAGQAGPSRIEDWAGGTARVMRRHAANRVFNVLLSFLLDLKVFSLRGQRFDAIQVRDKVVGGLLGLIAARLNRVPFFYWMSFPMPESDLELVRMHGLSLGPARAAFVWLKGHITSFILYRFLLRHADQFFVQSDRMLMALVERGGDASRMIAVPMGVDMEAVAAVQPKPYPGLGGRQVLVYLGALDRSRRLDFLLRVLAIVRRQAPEAALLMIGRASESTDEEWLKNETAKLGLTDHVVWAGWLPMQEAWCFAKSADVGLSPIPPGRLFDISSPTKAVEYLALGLPVVANDIPDQAEVISKSGAGICASFDENQFAQAIVELLADPGRRAAMAIAGPAYVAKHRCYSVLAATVAERYRRLVPVQRSRTGRSW